MSQLSHTYTQGHTASTLATHLLRTAEVDGGFLLPHIQKTHHILDIGCGPGTITTGFVKYATEGGIVGVDFSEGVVEKAKALAAGAKIPTEGPGSVTFQHGDVLKKLPFDDETFDIDYCSQLFGHLPPPDQPLKALAEIRRVLKKGGILATRDGSAQHFYPSSLNLDKLWGENSYRMPALLRRSGFDVDGNVQVSGAASILTGREARVRIANRGAEQLKKGEPFYHSWLDAGISEDEIEKTLEAVNKWAETEDAWFSSTQVQILAWK